MSFFISNAMADAAAPAAAGPMGGGFEWIFLVGFLVIFYLMIWRPQAKRAKEQKNLLGSLQKGDEVVTSWRYRRQDHQGFRCFRGDWKSPTPWS
jgi:preprotein translocase subunit YajC